MEGAVDRQFTNINARWTDDGVSRENIFLAVISVTWLDRVYYNYSTYLHLYVFIWFVCVYAMVNLIRLPEAGSWSEKNNNKMRIQLRLKRLGDSRSDSTRKKLYRMEKSYYFQNL